MAVHSATKNTFLRPSPKTANVSLIPAPIGGIDARTVLAEGNPLYCIYMYNMTPSEYGLKVRRGYREWAIELDNGSPLGVSTIIPFGGIDDNEADDRLFAVSNEGIWDVTTEGTAPALLVDFSDPGNGGDTTSAAGWGVYTQFTTNANEQLLYYADSINGLFVYSATTDLWTRPVGITGVDITLVNFVTAHKSRLWFVEQNDASAWYLDLEAISGAATQFFFGTKFKHGGDLAGLFSWSIDGGDGLDDYFVAVSRAGDVLPYRGNDPSDASTWASAGQYFIGAVPKGTRFGSGETGNLYLLSIFGLISMQELIRGVYAQDIRENTEAFKIALIVRDQMTSARNNDGWQVKTTPSLGQLLINSPANADGTYIQYSSNTATSGWGIWRGVPMLGFDEWKSNVYFGTEDNRVCVMDTDVDNSLITPAPESVLNGDAIEWSLLTTFQDLGQPSLFKRGKYIRAQFVSTIQPNVTSRFRYDFNLSEVINNSGSALRSTSFWNVGTWDGSLWSSSVASGKNDLEGGFGMGRKVAVATNGNSRSETTLISWDVLWDTGAPI